MTLTRRLVVFTAIALSISACGRDLSVTHQLEAEVTVDPSVIRITYENTSGSTVLVGGISLFDPRLAGTYLHVSDAANGEKYELPSSMTYYARGEVERLQRLHRLEPGGRITSEVKVDELFDAYLIPRARCIDVVAFYSRRIGERIVKSGPSAPVRVCNQ